MKKVKFVKDHVSGIGKDSVVKLEDAHADRLIEEEAAVEADGKAEYKRTVSKITDPGKALRAKKAKALAAKKKKLETARAADFSQGEGTGKE